MLIQGLQRMAVNHILRKKPTVPNPPDYQDHQNQVPAFLPPEPIIKPESHLPQVLLCQHVLIPHDELYHAKLIHERDVYQEIENQVFGRVDLVCALFQDRSGAEEGYPYGSSQGISLHRPQDFMPSPWISLEPSVCV